jgi:2-dehydropantoate 2-reductase
MHDAVKEISSVLIVGAGAVGVTYAGIIEDRLPGSVRVLAGGERLLRCRAEGFIVNGKRYDFPLDAPDSTEKADFIIVGVKNHHLQQAIADMKRAVGPDTLILSLLNGITSEDDLAAAFGAEKVPYAMILGIDAVRIDNSTRYSSPGSIHFGDAKNTAGGWSPRVSRIASFFRRAGVPFTVPPDMVRNLWYKFMINVGINQASAVIRAPYGVFQTDPDAQTVMDAAMAEVVALSRVKGTGLVDADIQAWRATLAGLGPGMKTSMLQDVEAGRKTEVEAFAGVVIGLGREAGIPVPVNRTLFGLLRAIESGFTQRAQGKDT